MLGCRLIQESNEEYLGSKHIYIMYIENMFKEHTRKFLFQHSRGKCDHKVSILSLHVF
jgi:hypothetical protein